MSTTGKCTREIILRPWFANDQKRTINIVGFFADSTPLLERYVGFWVAYLIPCCAMWLALLSVLFRRSHFGEQSSHRNRVKHLSLTCNHSPRSAHNQYHAPSMLCLASWNHWRLQNGCCKAGCSAAATWSPSPLDRFVHRRHQIESVNESSIVSGYKFSAKHPDLT